MKTTWRQRLYTIIFEAETPGGRLFDLVLILAILLSTFLVALESVGGIDEQYGGWIFTAEWVLTGLFTFEYLLRIYCSPKRGEYLCSFFGVVDLLSVLPAYFALFGPSNSHYLVTIRMLRLLRIFRVLKLIQLSGEAQKIVTALQSSAGKIGIFFYSLIILVVLEGTMMYLIEGDINPGLGNIPQCIYWAIVTMTTVGYGDAAPVTVGGKLLASFIMLSGYAVIAVPTGLVTAELTRARGNSDELLVRDRTCFKCALKGHTAEASFCRRCGERLGT